MDDFAGLFSASDARAVGRGNFVSWIGQDQPDYVIVVRPIVGIQVQLESFSTQAWFPKFFHPVYSYDDLVVYQRTGVAP